MRPEVAFEHPALIFDLSVAGTEDDKAGIPAIDHVFVDESGKEIDALVIDHASYKNMKWQVGRHVELGEQADLVIFFPLVNILLEFDLEIRITRWIPVIIIDTIDLSLIHI